MASFTGRRTLGSLLARALSSSSSSPYPSGLSPRSRMAAALLSHPFSPHLGPHPLNPQARPKTSGSGYSTLNDPSPNCTNLPPKETILLDGCDYEHWLVVMDFPTNPKPPEEEMINSYVKTLAAVVGSEEEAKKKIYSVCTTTYMGFGCLISEELSLKLRGLPDVLWVLADSYLDVTNKDYGGDLFYNGKVIHRPQFWYTDRQPARKPRRRETVQVEKTINQTNIAQADPQFLPENLQGEQFDPQAVYNGHP